MIQRVDEVGSKLHPEPLCDLEVFVNAEIQVEVARRAQTSELRCAVSEGARRRLNKVSVVDKPLTANPHATDYRWSICDGRQGVAVWPRSTTEGTGVIRTEGEAVASQNAMKVAG